MLTLSLSLSMWKKMAEGRVRSRAGLVMIPGVVLCRHHSTDRASHDDHGLNSAFSSPASPHPPP